MLDQKERRTVDEAGEPRPSCPRQAHASVSEPQPDDDARRVHERGIVADDRREREAADEEDEDEFERRGLPAGTTCNQAHDEDEREIAGEGAEKGSHGVADGTRKQLAHHTQRQFCFWLDLHGKRERASAVWEMVWRAKKGTKHRSPWDAGARIPCELPGAPHKASTSDQISTQFAAPITTMQNHAATRTRAPMAKEPIRARLDTRRTSGTMANGSWMLRIT
jgi:hypothetical protein